MNQRIFYFFGLFAPILFVFTAILGGVLRPGYSHITNTVSELFSPGSPNRLFLTVLYLLFSVSLSLFGFGLLKYVQSIGKNIKIGGLAAYIFIFVGVLNIFTATVFPQDPWGTPTTFPGEMHMIVSGIISVFSLIYMLLFGIWFRQARGTKAFMVYCFATIAGSILSGVWFAISVGSPMMGIAERVAIFIGFQWTLILSILIINSDKELSSQPS
ncbi:MAG: DUF998 domain-containing protein [Anaerolineales bacterium]